MSPVFLEMRQILSTPVEEHENVQFPPKKKLKIWGESKIGFNRRKR